MAECRTRLHMGMVMRDERGLIGRCATFLTARAVKRLFFSNLILPSGFRVGQPANSMVSV